MNDSLFNTLSCGRGGISRRRKGMLLDGQVFRDRSKGFDVQQYVRYFSVRLPTSLGARGPVVRVSLGPRPSSMLSSDRLTSVTGRCVSGLKCNGRPCVICGRYSVTQRRVRVISVHMSSAKGGVGSGFRRMHDGRVAHRLRRGCKLRPTRGGRTTRHPRLGGISCQTKSMGRRLSGAIGTLINDCHFRDFARCGTLLSVCGMRTRRIGKRIGNGPCGNVICSTAGNGKRGRKGPFGSSSLKGSMNCRTVRQRVGGSAGSVRSGGLGRHAHQAINTIVGSTRGHGRLRRRLGGGNVSMLFQRGSANEVCNMAFVSRRGHAILGNSQLKGSFSTGIFGSLFSNSHALAKSDGRRVRRRTPRFGPAKRLRGANGTITKLFDLLSNRSSAPPSGDRVPPPGGGGGGGREQV